MSIIEQAAERLEQLRKAGIDVPLVDSNPAQAATPAPAAPAVAPVAAGLATPDAALPQARASAEPGRPSLGGLGKKRSQRVTLDLARLQAAGMVTPDSSNSKIAGEFRVIKRPLLANAQGKGVTPVERGNLIMVTSALAGEGKSFVAVNLAMSIAMEVDSRVLLVDGDVVAPGVMRTLGLTESKGLINLLTTPSLDVGDVLLKTNVERLSILPAGTAHDRASELLASDAMARLLGDLATRYPERIVLFDSPPLLATTESRALASHMGQIVVVIEADRTPKGTVEDALSKLESCPVVMTVLNKAVESELGSYYGYRSGKRS
ncbi:MAG: tyrosine-protein kinase family protein [Burkholderiales bacterium]|nr:tyrosine-protein kinase family protein [Burkholderiales bacterium]